MTRRRLFARRIGGDFAGYVALKRALGRKFVNEEKVLRHLDSFVARRFPAIRDLSVPILEAWMVASPGLLPQSCAVRLRVVRQFCLYRRRTLSDAFVPDRIQHRWLWPERVSRHVPFIFTKEQVRNLLRAALALHEGPSNSSRPRIFFTVLLLLYAAGLRLCEAVRLRVSDVDFATGTLLIRETKFFKTRLTPVAEDVLHQLRLHIRALRLPRTRARAEQPLFQHDGRAYSIGTVGATGRRLLRAIGLKPARGRVGARLHCLRHSFAVHRIASWYAEGADVQSRLPALATYMGHTSIASTQYYVTVTAEILKHAGRRYERACAPKTGGGS
jgi:site-specific recombinase XerD